MLSKVICGVGMATYYHELIKPGFAPLGIIFPIVWTVLYRLTALIDLMLLLIFVLAMIYKFYKIKPTSAYLNIPYVFWLIYALVLNYYIWFINK